MSEFVVNGEMFGKYAKIPTGYSKEMHIYKVIGVLKSNFYCDVPLTGNTAPYIHKEIVPVLNVIHCGVDESEVERVALSDCVVMERLTDERRTMSMCMSVDECKKHNRLWEYEQSGLTPADITAMQTELAAYRQAEAEGTLVRVPTEGVWMMITGGIVYDSNVPQIVGKPADDARAILAFGVDFARNK